MTDKERIKELEQKIIQFKKENTAKEKIMEDIISTHVITQVLRNVYRRKWNSV